MWFEAVEKATKANTGAVLHLSQNRKKLWKIWQNLLKTICEIIQNSRLGFHFQLCCFELQDLNYSLTSDGIGSYFVDTLWLYISVILLANIKGITKIYKNKGRKNIPISLKGVLYIILAKMINRVWKNNSFDIMTKTSVYCVAKISTEHAC